MKQTLSLVTILLLTSFFSFSQDYSSKTVQELEKLKTEAIKSEDYQKAGQLNDEIKRRANEVSNVDRIAQAKSEMKAAVAKEDYQLASDLKKEIELREKLETAVENEEYVVAASIKKELEGDESTTVENSTPTQIPVSETIEEKELPPVSNQNITVKKNENLYGLKLRWGLSLGAIKFKTTKIQPETKYTPLVGIRLGLDYDTKLFVDFLSFETGLTFSYNQYKLDIPELSPKINYKTINLGTQFLVNYRFANDRLGIGAGPFFDVGLYGKQNIEKGESYDMYKGNDLQVEAPMKRLNVGLELKANYNFGKSKRAGLYFSFRKGLTNIENIEAPSGIDQSVKTWLISFGLKARLTK